MWLPTNRVGRLKKTFTLEKWSMGPNTAPTKVEAYLVDRPYIGVPRQAGLKLISSGDFDDDTAQGTPVTFPTLPKLKDYQISFSHDILDKCRVPYADFRVEAPTGKGKTVCSLWAIGMLAVTAAVAVDQEKLMQQWVEQAQKCLGLDAKMSVKDIMKGKGRDIGIVQGSIANWEGCKLVVCMIQSLTRKDYPEEFWRYCGVLVVDECHVAGAPTFSKILLNFDASIRFGVSATSNRKDSLNKLLEWNLGEVEVMMENKHKASRVYYLQSEACVSWYSNQAKVTGRYLQELSSNSARNLLIAHAAKYLWETGRDVLLISDRVEQLSSIMALCTFIGIPQEVMGVYARSTVKWKYAKNPTPVRNPANWERGTEFTPIALVPAQVRTKKSELEEVIKDKRIIFATYGIFEKGVDVPRLSAGIDCTPRKFSVQVHGRILRTEARKKIPIWVTIRDVLSFRAEAQFLSRLNDYKSSNAEVYLWIAEKGIQKQDSNELATEVKDNIVWLKTQEIITRQDGNCTLTVLPTQRNSATRRVRPTASAIR